MNSNIFKKVTCLGCGWVAMQVSRRYAEDEVARFNIYFNQLTKEKQQDYYGGKESSVNQYERCLLCGGSYKNFRDSKPNDCPMGVTLNPIIDREE